MKNFWETCNNKPFDLKEVKNPKDKLIIKGIINDEKRHLRLLKTIK